MPLISKPNYNLVFASQAPSIDNPPEFNNYAQGWATSRENNGKPTIKQFNYVQQTSDMKSLWILQNGACLPYDQSIEYQEGVFVLRNGAIHRTTATGTEIYTSESPYDLKYFSQGVSYPANSEISLSNGIRVRNTSGANLTNNPNINMTGWTNISSSSLVIAENNQTQQQVNDLVKNKTMSFLDFGAKADGSDDSAAIAAAALWSSTNRRTVDGAGLTYYCHDVLFDSYCSFRNANFVQNVHDTDLVSVLTTATNREWLIGCRFDQITIDGKRILATNVKVQSAAEDGGRHGIRIRRPVRDFKITNSKITQCASDGIMIFPDLYGDGFVTSIIDFWVIDCELTWNRRHGGSSDRVDGLYVINTKMDNNGRYLDGHASDPNSSGAQGDKPVGFDYYYGNGWDDEQYDAGTFSKNVNFINCTGIDNAKGGLLFLAYAGATAVNTNINIIGGIYNKGVLNSQDVNAISITPNEIGNTQSIFNGVNINDVSIPVSGDAILLRNTSNYVVSGTKCILTAVEYATGTYDSLITVVNEAATSKNYQNFTTPANRFTYNRQFNILIARDVKSTAYDTTSAGIVHQDNYWLNGAQKGSVIANIKPSDSTVSIGFRMDDVNEHLRVETQGCTFRNDSTLMPVNNGELVIAPLTNTQVVIRFKGSDGVVRTSAPIAIS